MAQWNLRNGTWVCEPQGQGRDPHQVGDDCSHDGIVAQWGLTSDGRWVCIPQEQGRDPHQVGDDCSHDGIVAQWGLTPDGRWICIPQEQGGDDAEPYVPDAPTAVPGER
ncbi:hypothetical protein [Nocardia sp. IFM 10818]